MQMKIHTTITTRDKDEFDRVRTAYGVINGLRAMFENVNPTKAEMLEMVMGLLSDISYVGEETTIPVFQKGA